MTKCCAFIVLAPKPKLVYHKKGAKSLLTASFYKSIPFPLPSSSPLISCLSSGIFFYFIFFSIPTIFPSLLRLKKQQKELKNHHKFPHTQLNPFINPPNPSILPFHPCSLAVFYPSKRKTKIPIILQSPLFPQFLPSSPSHLFQFFLVFTQTHTHRNSTQNTKTHNQ